LKKSKYNIKDIRFHDSKFRRYMVMVI